MNQYGVMQAIVMSFYSKKLYRDVAINYRLLQLYLLYGVRANKQSVVESQQETKTEELP